MELTVFLPELKGRSQEEINLLFDLRMSAIKSTTWRPTDIRTDLEALPVTHEADVGKQELAMNHLERETTSKAEAIGYTAV